MLPLPSGYQADASMSHLSEAICFGRLLPLAFLQRIDLCRYRRQWLELLLLYAELSRRSQRSGRVEQGEAAVQASYNFFEQLLTGGLKKLSRAHLFFICKSTSAWLHYI